MQLCKLQAWGVTEYMELDYVIRIQKKLTVFSGKVTDYNRLLVTISEYIFKVTPPTLQTI